MRKITSVAGGSHYERSEAAHARSTMLQRLRCFLVLASACRAPNRVTIGSPRRTEGQGDLGADSDLEFALREVFVFCAGESAAGMLLHCVA